LVEPVPRENKVLIKIYASIVIEVDTGYRRSPGIALASLVSEWAAGCKRPVAWLSLDEGDYHVLDAKPVDSALIFPLETLRGESNSQ
jgi:hypothetical protein